MVQRVWLLVNEVISQGNSTGCFMADQRRMYVISATSVFSLAEPKPSNPQFSCNNFTIHYLCAALQVSFWWTESYVGLNVCTIFLPLTTSVTDLNLEWICLQFEKLECSRTTGTVQPRVILNKDLSKLYLILEIRFLCLNLAYSHKSQLYCFY